MGNGERKKEKCRISFIPSIKFCIVCTLMMLDITKYPKTMASTKSVPAWRGCSSSLPQPLNQKDELELESLMKTLEIVNTKGPNAAPYGIQYRGYENDHDIRSQVFRWDLTPYQEVFEHGLKVNRNSTVQDGYFYNLHDYVLDKESESLDSRTQSMFGFISTTVSNSWCPYVQYDHSNPERHVEIYRYEIYAPGGIWSAITLGNHDERNDKRYDEVAFVSGIAPQYIRSAQLLRLKPNLNRTVTVERVDTTLIINKNFNPQSHPLKLLELQIPIADYMDGNNNRTPLNLKIHPDDKPNQPTSDPIEWYTQGVTNLGTYVDAAFRSTAENEAYYIQKNRCFLLNYDPTGTNDFIVDGPHFLYDMFQSLKNTPFGHHGIDCAFGRHDSEEAYIFCGNLCAQFNYAPHRKDDKIIDGPKPILHMFNFLKGTVFEGGIDAAFQATNKDEAYLFKGDKCAKVNYGYRPRIISIESIGEVFPSLKGKPFETKVDAAYASHLKDEAYIFSNNQFAQVNFASRTVIYAGPIGSQAEAIKRLFPYKNRGVDL